MRADAQKKLLAACGRYVRSQIKTRVEPLEKRLAEVERYGIKFCGVHQRAMEYSRGAVVTHEGCAWVAVVDKTGALPGVGADWQLMVKAGRDGRDAR